MKRVSFSPTGSKQSTKTLSPVSLPLCAVLLLLACHDRSPTAPLKTVPMGSWGGAQISLTVTQTGGILKQLCADGTIDQPMTLDADGRFNVTGRYNRQVGGPSIGEGHPARFTGSTDGRTMRLMVTQTDDNQTFGPLTLIFEQQTQIGPCPLV